MNTLRFALKKVIPLIFSYVFVGLAFGMIAHQQGLSVL